MTKKLKIHNQRELFGMLCNLQDITIDNWDLVKKIVNNISDITIISKRWLDWDYKNDNPQYYPLDLSKIKTWSTYSNKGCINLRFFIRERKLIYVVVIWDGDSFNGYPKNKRFHAVLQFKNKFIKELNLFISRKFDNLLSDAYEDYLERQRKDWINNLREEFFQVFNNQ